MVKLLPPDYYLIRQLTGLVSVNWAGLSCQDLVLIRMFYIETFHVFCIDMLGYCQSHLTSCPHNQLELT